MKRWWMTVFVSVIVLSGAGCRRDQEGAESRAFDANVDSAAAPLPVEPSPDIVADQTAISRRTQEAASAAPKAAASTAPTTGPTTGPATAPTTAPTASPAPGAEAAPGASPAPSASPAASPGPDASPAASPNPAASPAAAPTPGAALDPETTTAVELTVKAVQDGLGKQFDAPFADFLCEADAAAVKPIAENAKKAQEQIRATVALGQSKIQTDLSVLVGKGLNQRMPWLPGLNWASASTPPAFTKVGEKVQGILPDGKTVILLVKSGDKWKIEYNAAQRETLKLVAAAYEAELKFLDTVQGDLNGGAVTAETVNEKTSRHYEDIMMPAWHQLEGIPDLTMPVLAGPGQGPGGRGPGGPGPGMRGPGAGGAGRRGPGPGGRIPGGE
jgi:hypothetical protein